MYSFVWSFIPLGVVKKKKKKRANWQWKNNSCLKRFFVYLPLHICGFCEWNPKVKEFKIPRFRLRHCCLPLFCIYLKQQEQTPKYLSEAEDCVIIVTDNVIGSWLGLVFRVCLLQASWDEFYPPQCQNSARSHPLFARFLFPTILWQMKQKAYRAQLHTKSFL